MRWGDHWSNQGHEKVKRHGASHPVIGNAHQYTGRLAPCRYKRQSIGRHFLSIRTEQVRRAQTVNTRRDGRPNERALASINNVVGRVGITAVRSCSS